MSSVSTTKLVFSLREQIVEQLRNDLLAGRFGEGERLSEVSLASRFGVSRTPVREALQQLVQEGLLEGRPNVGVMVAPRPPDAIRDLVVPIRRSVEEFALRSYFDELGEQDFGVWERILERMHEACLAHDFSTVAEQDVAFHRAIVRRAGESDLEQIWTTLVARMRPHFLTTQQEYPDLSVVHDEHRAILDVFREGDVESAVRSLLANIS
jgi:DNA-binding GntR family transcriptional regulator